MEFTRRKVRGRTQKSYREWHDETGQYRLQWRSEVHGVEVQPAYHAAVRAIRLDGYQFWDFCGRRAPYKTLGKAKEAAEKHQKLWSLCLEIVKSERKGRNDRLRDLDERARVGSHRLLTGMPLWVWEIDPNIHSAIFPSRRHRLDREDLTLTCETTETASSEPGPVPEITSETAPTPGPASSVAAGEEPGTPESESAEPSPKSPARSAKGGGKARKKSVKKPTTKRSPTGKRKSASTKA